jgi:uncharacterized protein (DUF927 family)
MPTHYTKFLKKLDKNEKLELKKFLKNETYTKTKLKYFTNYIKKIKEETIKDYVALNVFSLWVTEIDFFEYSQKIG